MRSANGFVPSLIVPEGNAADSAMLVDSIIDAKNRSGVLPGSVSTDDGYASAKGLQTLLGLGIKTVSISGAKGKSSDIMKTRVLTSPVCQISEEKPNACRNTGEMIKPLIPAR